MTAKKPRAYDPYGLEPMIEEFGQDSISLRFEPAVKRRQRLREMADASERIRRKLGLLFESREDTDELNKLERAFFAKHKVAPLLFRDENRIWWLWHAGQIIAAWPDDMFPQLGPFLITEVLGPLKRLLELIGKESARKSGHGRRMLAERLKSQGRRRTKSDDVYAEYLKGNADVGALAKRFDTSPDYVRQAIRDHQNPASRKYKPRT